MTETTKIPRNIEQLRQAYMTVFSGFAVDVTDLSNDLGVSRDTARRLLKKLEAANLVGSYDVNEESQGSGRRGQYKELVWQCNETYDNATPEQAAATFDRAFGIKSEHDAGMEILAAKFAEQDAERREPGTVTLTAKTDGKTPWHFRNADTSTVTGECGLVLQDDTTEGITVHIVDSIDERVERHANRPICGNCRDQHRNRRNTAAPMTEEVTMSTTTTNEAPAAPAAETAAKPTTPAKAAVEIPVDLEKTLLSQVKAMKPKPELKPSPSGSYTAIKVGGKPVGYLHPATRKGIRLHLAAAPKDVKAAGLKGAEAYSKGSVQTQVYITATDQVESAVKALALAIPAKGEDAAGK